MEVLKTRDINWSLYDWNGDGYINQLLIIYAGKSMHSDGDDNTIWAHQWWMSEHLKDLQEGVYCDPIPVSSGGKDYLVDCYCALNELTKNDDYGSFSTICHEYSHCFGFPDFNNSIGNTVVGEWDLMDRGNLTDDGYLPPGYSAHERWMMGWLTPTELSTATTVTNIPTLSDEPQAYIIRNDGHQDEYYIVENRQKKGWDTALPGSGIVIFHIDFDADLWTSTTTVPNTKNRQHYVIFHANNSTSTSTQSRWAYPYNGNNELTDTSSPAATLWNDNANGQKLMSKPITDITVHNDKGAFVFMGGSTGIQTTTLTQSAQVLYRFGDISIVRGADGKTQKVIQPKR
jgi:M6 family metalloprotease-like protein